jgi:hypothetical protein
MEGMLRGTSNEVLHSIVIMRKIIMTHTFIKPLVVALLLGVLPLSISSAFAVTDCVPYHWGDQGPDGGKVFYVDGSGCHGLEARAPSATQKAGMTWANAIKAAAAYNVAASPITGAKGLNCSKTALPSLQAPPATPNCWHLPSIMELRYLYDKSAVVGGFPGDVYWSSTQSNSLHYHTKTLPIRGVEKEFNKTLIYNSCAVRAF